MQLAALSKYHIAGIKKLVSESLQHIIASINKSIIGAKFYTRLQKLAKSVIT